MKKNYSSPLNNLFYTLDSEIAMIVLDFFCSPDDTPWDGVKKLDTTACWKQSNEDFLELVFSVSKLKHANVVELVGYCAEHGQQLLVFLGGDFGAGFPSPTLSA
ncbi:Protein STRUBBELIG-RECEPTOR FAMILY 3 [Camellia lanceoleosa]|uniref:Protein STRUBBELIG-RECEPTOR FAMILY 3 n=1 Tax=Camellia lanceoleosa TaxID=1840588 RepID=A0ACC0G546_9ERIC|nr:Protein STRUBBELIG-RECEPTOR FAMILY 3 [Camellia lanceoleosa]